jgi:putative inorganic carbon (hco3(-)) transporter
MPEQGMRTQRPRVAPSALPDWCWQRIAMSARHATDRDYRTAALALAGLAYYYLIPSPLLALPGLLLFTLCAWRRLPLVLCLLPLSFPYWFVPKRVAGHLVFPLSEIALAICVSIALIHAYRRLRWHATSVRWLKAWLRRSTWALTARLGGWTCLGAGLLLLGTLIGVALARRPPEALRTERWDVVEPLLYLALVAVYVRGRRQAGWLLWALLASAALLAVLALVQSVALHFTFTPLAEGNRLVTLPTSHGAAPRATAFVLSSSNNLGTWMERALPLALALCSVPGRVAPRERALAWACVLLYLPALFCSGSRGAWIATIAAVFVVLVVNLRRRLRALASVVALGALALVWQRAWLVRELLAAHGNSNALRLLVWRAAWNMARDHTLFGIGPDQFMYYYSSRYTDHPYWIVSENGHSTPAAQAPDIAHPHNLPLDLWLSGGLLALAGFTLALVDSARRCLRIWRSRQGQGWHAGVALGIGAFLLAGLVHGMVDSAYFFPDLALAFWWAVALLVVLERDDSGRHAPRTSAEARATAAPLR